MHDLYFYSTDLIFFFLRSDLAWSYMHRVYMPDSGFVRKAKRNYGMRNYGRNYA